jgi:hypothetical protein
MQHRLAAGSGRLIGSPDGQALAMVFRIAYRLYEGRRGNRDTP